MSDRLSRRDLLKAGGALAVTAPGTQVGRRAAFAQTPKRGGTISLRLWDPPHFDLHQTISYKTNILHTFTHSRLLKYKAGPGVQPGSFILEGDLSESWSQPNETTYIFDPDNYLFGPYMAGELKNQSHVNDPVLGDMLIRQRRTADVAKRREVLHEIQRYAAKQQYYVYAPSGVYIGVWDAAVKNYVPNLGYDWGGRLLAAWLDR